MRYVLPEPLVAVQLMATKATEEHKTEGGIIIPAGKKPEAEEPDEAEFGLLLSDVYYRDKDGNKMLDEKILFKAGIMVAFPRLQGIKINDPETGEQLKIIEDEFIIAAVFETDEKQVEVDSRYLNE